MPTPLSLTPTFSTLNGRLIGLYVAQAARLLQFPAEG
jgi:hypothetical protein